MEMEFFVPPEEAERWFEHWLSERERWYVELACARTICACAARSG